MELHEIEVLLRANEHHFAEMREEMKRWDKLYNREYVSKFPLPDNVYPHESAMPSLIIDNLRDQIRMDEPTITYRARGTSQEALTHKSLMEMWGARVFSQIEETHLINPFQQAPHDLLLRGAACFKFAAGVGLVPKREDFPSVAAYKLALKEWEALEADQFPFFVKTVDPLSLYPSPGLQKLTYMIEEQTRRLIDMEEYMRAELWTDPLGKKRMRKDLRDNPLREVKWVELWKPDGYAVVVDGEKIKDMANPYGGIIPYSFRYSGFGRAHADGNPKHLAIGILSSITGELEGFIEMMTAMRAAWQMYVFPRLLTTDDATATAKKFRKGPGGVIQYKSGEPPTWLEQPEPSPQMLAFLAQIKDTLNRKVSPALTENQADFGIQQALLIGQALKVISPVKSALNSMATELLNGLAHITHLHDIRMNVHGGQDEVDKERMVRGADFTHPAFAVKFEAIDPVENDRRMLSALGVKREPWTLSNETYTEKFLKGIVDNPTEEQAKLLGEALVQQLIESGWMMNFVVNEVLTRREGKRTQSAATELSKRVESTAGGAAEVVAGRERTLEALAGTGLLPRETARATQTAVGV